VSDEKSSNDFDSAKEKVEEEYQESLMSAKAKVEAARSEALRKLQS
jgi:hypothetical protein